MNKIHIMHKTKAIIFYWIPHHNRFKKGNDADSTGKPNAGSQHQNTLDWYKSYSEWVHQIDMINVVQKQSTKLSQIWLALIEWAPELRYRKEEEVLTRRHIGHTLPVHACILKHEKQPKCAWGKLIKVKHIVLLCK